jgi:hypothetical protein
MDTQRQEVEAGEEEVSTALLTTLVICFYTAEDSLKDLSISGLHRAYRYVVSRLIEIFTGCRYCHVQVYIGGESNHVGFHGMTYLEDRQWFHRPYTTAYRVQCKYVMPMYHESRMVSLWKNIRWWFKGGRVPVNCISDAEMILRAHLVDESNHACKTRRYCRSIEEIEDAIRSGYFSNAYWIQLSPCPY